jgi:hypothetical protein
LTEPEIDEELRAALVAWADRMVEAELRHQEAEGWLTLCAIEADHPTVEVWFHQTGDPNEPSIVSPLRDLLEHELSALTRYARPCREAVANGDRFESANLKNWAGLREMQALLHEYAGYMDVLMPEPP